MRVKFQDLWTLEGTLNRSTYALIGVIGFAIKHNLDRVVASAVFARPWALFNYWIPLNKAIRISALSPGDARFLLTMVVISLPFIWVGIVCTLKRLRDAGLSPGWVIMFFLPFVNLLFFVACCLIPSRIQQQAAAAIPDKSASGGIGTWIPKSKIGSASLAALSTGIVGYAIGYFSMDVLTQYGWGLFVALPFCMGFVAVLLYGFHKPRSLGSSITVSCVTVAVLAALLLALGGCVQAIHDHARQTAIEQPETAAAASD